MEKIDNDFSIFNMDNFDIEDDTNNQNKIIECNIENKAKDNNRQNDIQNNNNNSNSYISNSQNKMFLNILFIFIIKI